MWQYAKMGVLWTGVREIVRCLLHGRSLKAVYPEVTRLVDKELVNKYETELKLLRSASIARYENDNDNVNHNLNHNHNDNDNHNENENQDNFLDLKDLNIFERFLAVRRLKKKELLLAKQEISQIEPNQTNNNDKVNETLRYENETVQAPTKTKDNSLDTELLKEQEISQIEPNQTNNNDNLNVNANVKVNDTLCYDTPATTKDLEPAQSNHNFQFSLFNSQFDKVWFCWLQGMEKAPELVRVCLESIRKNVTENVVVLDDSNFKEYVTLPEYVMEKYRRGRIPGALFSDMLRLELLIKYGGTWIDATVLASPGAGESKLWKEIGESELFVYRYFRQGRVVGTSNWFIHAKAGNRLLMDVRDMLYAYWRDYDCVVEYYIFHLFFGVAAKRYPELMARMPKGNSYHALLLRDNGHRMKDREWMDKLMANVPFHKLNYRRWSALSGRNLTNLFKSNK